MTTNTETTPSVDEVLATLQAKLDEIDIRRTQAQREADAYAARMEALARRISAIRVATTTLAGLAPLAPEQEWRDQLTAWRKALSAELLELPARIRDPRTLGLQTEPNAEHPHD